MRRDYKGISINTSKNTHETVFELVGNGPESRIVDVPCGSGAFIQRLKDHDYHHVYGIDIEDGLEIDHESFRQGDMTDRLPLDDESVDTLVCIDGIEHIDRQQDFISEVLRVLRPGGEFIVSTPNISSIRSRWKWLLTGHHNKCNSPLDEKNPGPLHHIGLLSFPEIRYLLHSAGFQIEQVATNRTKAVSWLYLPLAPFLYLATSLVYHRRGKMEQTESICNDVQKSMFTLPLLLGETMIIRAVRQ